MDEKSIIKRLKKMLKPSRFKHSLRVRDKVLQLSRFYHIDLKKASTAGLLHDVSRFMDRPGMLKYAQKLGLNIDPIERKEPKLLHARLSAYIARTRFGVKDPQILRAISSHTLGRKKMSMLEKVVYIADHIEEARSHSGVKKARALAKKDINKTIVAIATSMISYLLDNEMPVHPGTYEVRNYYI